MTDDDPGNDITYIAEALGSMPAPMPRIFDIYAQKRTRSEVDPGRFLYEDNKGLGYTEEQAKAKVIELNAMRIGKFTFTKRLRNIPKPDVYHVEEEFTGRDENGELLF